MFFLPVFDQKLPYTNPYSLKVVQATGEAFRTLKKEHRELQKIKFINIFSIFVGNFCPPVSGSVLRIRIPIRIHGPH
jgi:hypothetical protein